MTPIERIERLGRLSITISICCGPCGQSPFTWTVQALSRDGHEFEQPFAATSFEHAIEIAEIEITKRGWIKVTDVFDLQDKSEVVR